MKTYVEPAVTLPVYDECDILVVGSGSAGHSAAIAAARAGCKNIILLERYGYSGGDVTGGYVLMVPKLSWYDCSFVRGLQEEWFTRLEKIPGAVLGPDFSEMGTDNPLSLERWGVLGGPVAGAPGAQRIVRSMYYEPVDLKIIMDKMLLEEKDSIRVMYHSWGTKPIMEDGVCKGVIFESKEGRKVILAKQVIDATGDGDLFRQSGAPYKSLADSNTRSSSTALVWRIGGVDQVNYYEWKKQNPAAANALRRKVSQTAGFASGIMAESRPDICWVNNWHREKDCSKIRDLTITEMETRNTIYDVLDMLKKYCPAGFRDAYLYDIAPQTGTRCSNRLIGEHVITTKDFAENPHYEDVIAWHSTICRINDSAPIEIPFRAILPQKVDNLLCPGRHISADDIAIDWVNLIPQCVGTGQAAGVAAAVAVEQGTDIRSVDIKRVQDILAGEQDVPLPRNEHTDKKYTECCEAHEYGLYTDIIKNGDEYVSGYSFYKNKEDGRGKREPGKGPGRGPRPEH